MKKIHRNFTKDFQNLLILEASLSISIHSKNSLYLYDGFLVPQKEYEPVYVR
jgi:hypothetical protein